MSAPFSIVWYDISNNVLSDATFNIAFPDVSSEAKQLQIKSNSAAILIYNTMTEVKFFLTGDPDDVDIVQQVWPSLGDSNRPELNGGFEVSFDFGRTFIRFDSTHGVESIPSTYIPLPIEAVGQGGAAETLGPFDAAHLIARYIIPPGATQFRKLDVRLGLDFDII